MAALLNAFVLSLIHLFCILPSVEAGDTVKWINPRAAVIGDVILVQGGQRIISENNVSSLLSPTVSNYLYNISLNCPFRVKGSNAKIIDDLLQDIPQLTPSAAPQIWWGGGLFYNSYEFYTFG